MKMSLRIILGEGYVNVSVKRFEIWWDYQRSFGRARKVRSVLLGEMGRKGNSDEVIYFCMQALGCGTS